MNKKIVMVLLCMAVFRIYAQVEFVEPNSRIATADPSKQWAHMNVNRPYDSIDFVVPVWPTIEAYKKYVGQTFFLLAQKQSRSVYYLNNMTPQSRTTSTSDVIILTGPLKKDKYKCYKRGKLAEIVNKYYNIVDVVNYMDENGKPRKRFALMKQTGYNTYSYPCRDEENKMCSSPAEVPVFVMVEQMSGDTCYTAFPEKFMLVGAYVKIEKNFQDARLSYMVRKITKNEKERWRIVKIGIATRDFYDYPDYEGLPTMSFIIENSKGIQKAIPVKEYVSMKWWSADDPQLVNDALSQKKAVEEDQQCCTDVVKDLDLKYAGSKEMQELRPANSPSATTTRTTTKKTLKVRRGN